MVRSEWDGRECGSFLSTDLRRPKVRIMLSRSRGISVGTIGNVIFEQRVKGYEGVSQAACGVRTSRAREIAGVKALG